APALGASPTVLVAASPATGVVALVDPATGSITGTTRLPVTEDIALAVSPSDDGALITMVASNGATALLRLDRAAGIAAHRPGQASPPAQATRHGTLFHDPGRDWLFLLDERLGSRSKRRLGLAGAVALGWSDVGDTFAVVSPVELVVGAVVDGKLALGERFRIGDFVRGQQRRHAPPAARPLRAWEPARAVGETGIGFAASRKPEPWTLAPGDFALTVPLRSTGAPGGGLRVELSGDALRRASFLEARVGAHRAAFGPVGAGVVAAELPDVALPEGVPYPLDPKPRTP